MSRPVLIFKDFFTRLLILKHSYIEFGDAVNNPRF